MPKRKNIPEMAAERSLGERLQDPELIRAALYQGVIEALDRRRRLGWPVVVWNKTKPRQVSGFRIPRMRGRHGGSPRGEE